MIVRHLFPQRISILATAAVLSLAGTACADSARLPVSAGTGPVPTLPEPDTSLIPTVHVAKAVGWPQGGLPTPAKGLTVRALATGLAHPRWPSANRITLLRDADGDGVVDLRTVFLENLNSPFGMALVGDTLYVANTDGVVRFPYKRATRASGGGHQVDGPARRPHQSPLDQELIASPTASLYATVGSNSNVAENGMEGESGRAAIWEIDPRDRRKHPPVRVRPAQSGRHGLGTRDGALWTAVNERDELGSDLVPDYMTSVKDGGFYGWPYSYYGSTSTRASSRSARIWSPRRSCPITRWGRTPRRSVAGPGLRAQGDAARPIAARAACSSASTARGTASRAAATR
jgi:glucose/arabinose dehydrogenase